MRHFDLLGITGPFDIWKKAVRQKEMSEMVCAHVHLKAVGGEAKLRIVEGHSGVVNEDIDGRILGCNGRRTSTH